MAIIVGVKILPKKEILDVQGRAIAKTLKQQGHPLEDCCYGKFLKLKVAVKDKKIALQKAKNMAEKILCNPLVESYELELLSE